MTKAAAIRFIAAFLTAGSLWLAWTQQRKGGQPRPADLAIDKIADDLYVIIGGGGNIGVLVTEEGVALVDDKFDRDVENILAKVKSVTDRPVRYVVNTHHHGDHSGGNAKLLAQAEIVMHKNARANVLKNSQPGASRLTYAKEASLYLGGKEIRVMHFGRAHTNGDSVIYFPHRKVIHTGDMFIRGAPFIDYANGGSALAWDRTISQVLQLDFDTVIPGHGPVGKRTDIAKWRADYELFRTRFRAIKRSGKSAEEIQAEISFEGMTGWNWSRLLLRSLPGLYEEL